MAITKVNHAAVHWAQHHYSRGLEVWRRGAIAVRNEQVVRNGGHICTGTDRTGWACTRVAIAEFEAGWLCRVCAPKATTSTPAQRQEPAPSAPTHARIAVAGEEAPLW